MSDKINAWIHWVKLNPINKDQLLFAIEVEKLKKENEVLREGLRFYADEKHCLKDFDSIEFQEPGTTARQALEQADKIWGDK